MLFYLHFVSTFTRCYALSGLCRSRNMSVCLSTHRYSVEVARVSSNLFHHRVASSHTILAFPYNTVSQYSDRDPLTGVSNGKGVLSQRGSAMLHVCQHLALDFSSIIGRALSSIISYFGLRFTAAYNLIMFILSWSSMLVLINKESLMCGGLCGKMHGRPSQLLIALQSPAVITQIFAHSTCIRRRRPTCCR